MQRILFLYKNILYKDKEVSKNFINLEGTIKIIESLLYGSGLRLAEALNLRIKDIDFDYKQILVRDGKGEKDIHTILPDSVIPELKKHLNRVYLKHKQDLKRGKGETILPYALKKKYPNAGKEFGWQYAFPEEKFIREIESGLTFRRHLHESTIQRVVKEVFKKVGLTKSASPHSFRHSFATHLPENGYAIRTIQELLAVSNSINYDDLYALTE